MTFKIGDKVKFLNDVGGGVISRISNNSAYVKDEDGFEIPVPFAELIKIEVELPIEKEDKPVRQSEKKQEKKAEPKKEAPIDEVIEDVADQQEEVTNGIGDFDTLNVLMGFTEEASRKDGKIVHAYLINDCMYRMLYTFSVVSEGHYRTLKAGMLEDETKVFLHSFSTNALKNINSFHIEAIFYKKTSFIPQEPLVYELKIDNFQFSNTFNYKENDYFDEHAYLINITELDLMAEIEKISLNQQIQAQEIIRKDSPKVRQIKVSAETEEIDLHIDKLTDNSVMLEAGEILDIQLSKFHIAMEGALRNNTKRIIFIHGVGNGKLKYELRKALDTKYPKAKYQDASFQEYGYGATMVMLK